LPAGHALPTSHRIHCCQCAVTCRWAARSGADVLPPVCAAVVWHWQCRTPSSTTVLRWRARLMAPSVTS
jgi:hypothetical protein